MSHRLIVRSEAEADLTEAALWYEGREAGLGLELAAEIRGAIQRAVERPLTCLRFRKQPEVRRMGSTLDARGHVRYHPRGLRRCREFFDAYPQIRGTLSPEWAIPPSRLLASLSYSHFVAVENGGIAVGASRNVELVGSNLCLPTRN